MGLGSTMTFPRIRSNGVSGFFEKLFGGDDKAGHRHATGPRHSVQASTEHEEEPPPPDPIMQYLMAYEGDIYAAVKKLARRVEIDDHARITLAYFQHDAGLVNDSIKLVRTLPELRALDIACSHITSDALEQIGLMKKMTELNLNATDIKEGCLQHLADLKDLKRMSLSGTKLLDPDFEDLKLLPQLEILNVSDTNMSNYGFQYLAPLENLKLLNLSGTRITDRGLRFLENMTSLITLTLNENNITDAGLTEMHSFVKRFKKLRYLNLNKTQVTDRAVASLIELMPGCTINMDEFNEGHPDQWGTAGWTDAERTGFSL